MDNVVSVVMMGRSIGIWNKKGDVIKRFAIDEDMRENVQAYLRENQFAVNNWDSFDGWLNEFKVRVGRELEILCGASSAASGSGMNAKSVRGCIELARKHVKAGKTLKSPRHGWNCAAWNLYQAAVTEAEFIEGSE